MKRLSLLIVLFCASLMTIAQDVIVKKDGSTVQCKVLEINEAEIKYKKWSNQEGPLYSINRKDVLNINYQNGEVESFTNEFLITNQSSCVEGKLAWKKRQLFLDGRELTEEEAVNLLGKEVYEDYLKGVRLSKDGDLLFLPGILGAVVLGPTCLLIGLREKSIITAGCCIEFVGIGCLIPGIVLKLTGKNIINNVVVEYNRNISHAILFDISPSIIKTEHIGQNNLGLGLTFSMNF